MRWTNAVVLVTGASSGIGRATAITCAERGADVLVQGRDPDRTRAAAASSGGTPLLADLARPGDRRQLIDDALAVRGRVDVVINNAGAGWSGPFTQMTEREAGELIDVNLTAPVEISRALLPPMLSRDRGAVGFVTSVAGRTGVAGESAYSAAKAGLDCFAESLRAEAQGTGVRISRVVPGVVDTGFFAARGSTYARRIPRPVTPDRVAQTLLDGIEAGRAESWVPGWLRVAPVVRAMLPGVYRALSDRFGEQTRLTPP